jgi:hypothetical protein
MKNKINEKQLNTVLSKKVPLSPLYDVHNKAVADIFLVWIILPGTMAPAIAHFFLF